MFKKPKPKSRQIYEDRLVKWGRVSIFVLAIILQNVFIFIYFYFIRSSEQVTVSESFAFQNALSGSQTVILIIIEIFISGAISLLNKIKTFFLNIASWFIDRFKKRGLENELKKTQSDFDESIANSSMPVAIKFIYNLSPKEKQKLYDLFLVLEEVRIKNIYAIKNEDYAFRCCLNEIYDSAKDSKFLLINSIAQHEFIGKYFKDFLDFESKKIEEYPDEYKFFKIIKKNKDIKIRILLLDPEDKKVDDIIERRIKQIGKSRYSNIEEYKNEIRKTIDFLEFLKNRRNIKIEYCLYNTFPIFRYYITDSRLFFSQYVPEYEGHESMVFEVGANTISLYFSFKELFEQRWNRFKKKQ